MNINEVIKYPILSEKTYKQMPNGVYTFAIDYRSDKNDLKRAVELIFNVKISKINIQNPPRRDKRMGKFVGKSSRIKKGIVFLKDGHSINYFPDDTTNDNKKLDDKDITTTNKVINDEKKETKLSDLEKKVAEKIKIKEEKDKNSNPSNEVDENKDKKGKEENNK